MHTRRTFLKTVAFATLSPELLAQTPGTSQYRVNERSPFIRFLTSFSSVDWAKEKTPVTFSIPSKEMDQNINQVIALMAQTRMDLNHLGTKDAKELGQKIRTATEQALGKKWSLLKQFDQEWLIAEAVCEFVKRNLKFAYDNVALTGEDSAKKADASYILMLPQPKAVCWGISIVTRDIARGAGLSCHFVSCNYRNLDKPAPAWDARTHGIVSFVFAGNVEVPADVTESVCRFQHQQGDIIRSIHDRKVMSIYILPRDIWAWEIFFAHLNCVTHLEQGTTISGDQQNKFLQFSSGLSYSDWSGADPAYLKRLMQVEERYDKLEISGRRGY